MQNRTIYIHVAAIFSALLVTLSLSAQQKVKFMAQWHAQAQFAGYYVAYEKGFYKEAGLDVEIDHLSSTSSMFVTDVVKQENVDIFTSELIASLIRKSEGMNIVNVLQTSQNSSLMLVSHSPITSFSDLTGKKVGRWRSGFAIIAEIFCKDFGLDVNWVPTLNQTNLYLANAIDATLAYSYSEYNSLLFSLGEINQENTIRFSDIGYNVPEEGIYTTSEFLKKHPDAVDKFIKATIDGWHYAAEHEDETLDYVMKYVRANNVVSSRPKERLMLREVIKLQCKDGAPKAGFEKLDSEIVDFLNDNLILLGYTKRPVIYKEFVR